MKTKIFIVAHHPPHFLISGNFHGNPPIPYTHFTCDFKNSSRWSLQFQYRITNPTIKKTLSGSTLSVFEVLAPFYWRIQSDRVCRGSCGAPHTGPVGVEKLATRLVHPLVGVRTKIIALGLK